MIDAHYVHSVCGVADAVGGPVGATASRVVASQLPGQPLAYESRRVKEWPGKEGRNDASHGNRQANRWSLGQGTASAGASDSRYAWSATRLPAHPVAELAAQLIGVNGRTACRDKAI